MNPNTSKKKQKRRKQEKHVKVSNSDPESGWFRKGEHKHVFAHSIQTACDENGVILGYSVHPGNDNDGKTFPAVMEKLEELPVEMVVGDTAYKTPAIAKLLHDKGIRLLSTYKRPQTKKGFFPNTTTVIYAPMTKCFRTIRRTGRDTGSTGARQIYAQTAHIWGSVLRARTM